MKLAFMFFNFIFTKSKNIDSDLSMFWFTFQTVATVATVVAQLLQLLQQLLQHVLNIGPRMRSTGPPAAARSRLLGWPLAPRTRADGIHRL